ncbi:MAG TPA: ABC transporter substrate-binding protein [Solirubrobacterales bacterium]
MSPHLRLPRRGVGPRRALAGLATLIAAALAVAGCGGGGSSGSSAAAGSGSSVGTATTASATGSSSGASPTVETIYGPVEVPTEPKKIVALDFPEATALADLGVKPVGQPFYIPALPAYEKFFKGIPKVTNSSAEPELEKIAALEPELIVGDANELEGKKQIYEELSQIAPTVLFEWTTAAGSWEADAMGTAEAIGEAPQLEELKGAYEDHAADIKGKYASWLGSHSIDLVTGEPGVFYLYNPTASHSRVLIAAGAHLGAGAKLKEGFAEYSTEKYPVLDHTGALVVDEPAPGGAKEVTENPLFENLPAAKAGYVMTTSFFFPSSYQIAEALLGEFEEFLAKEAR